MPTHAEWTADVRHLYQAMVAYHPNPYHSISQTALEAAVESLISDIEGLSDEAI